MLFEVACDGEGILRMALQAQMQRLDSLKEQECVERRQGSAGIAQSLDPRLENKRERPEGLDIGKAVIGRIGPGELLETSRSRPVKLASVDNDTADAGAVAAEKLGGGV